MNALSIISNVLAQAKKEDVTPSTPLIGEDGYFAWWQVLLFFVMLGLIGFYFYYRKKQQNQ